MNDEELIKLVPLIDRLELNLEEKFLLIWDLCCLDTELRDKWLLDTIAAIGFSLPN